MSDHLWRTEQQRMLNSHRESIRRRTTGHSGATVMRLKTLLPGCCLFVHTCPTAIQSHQSVVATLQMIPPQPRNVVGTHSESGRTAKIRDSHIVQVVYRPEYPFDGLMCGGGDTVSELRGPRINIMLPLSTWIVLLSFRARSCSVWPKFSRCLHIF